MTPQDIGNGRTIVKRMENFIHWCAWRYWLHRETGRTFSPDKMCVWGGWPPETMQLAQQVCQTIQETRRHPKVNWDFPVCDPAQPWDRWNYNEREDLARRHREDLFWIPPLPERRGTVRRPGPYKTPTQIELDNWINAEAAKKTYRKGDPLPTLFRTPWRKGKFKPGEEDEVPPEPMPFVATTPELYAERMASLERRLNSGKTG